MTLTGPEGSARRALAQHSALDAVGAFADGVWWVELAPIDRGDRVAEAIAMALGIPESTAVPAQDQVVRALADKRALLVLDNCEHMSSTLSAVVVELLARACPSLTVLATSREPFGTTAETIWRVPSLTTPTDEVASVADLSASDAARLFVARAQRARAGFQLTDVERAGVVAAICRRLDGIPLALELATARARVAPLERLATELNERFRVLTGGDRGALARHQTLLASVDWSHDLLSDKERKLFRRLCVFVATFGGDAVAAVSPTTSSTSTRRWTCSVDSSTRASYSSMTLAVAITSWRRCDSSPSTDVGRPTSSTSSAIATCGRYSVSWRASITRSARRPDGGDGRRLPEHPGGIVVGGRPGQRRHGAPGRHPRRLLGALRLSP